MMEEFNGQPIDWNNFTAKDALNYTKKAQKHLEEKEFIDIIKRIAEAADNGFSELKMSIKKPYDSTISKLKDKGFSVSVIEQKCYTTAVSATNSTETSHTYWDTIIKWEE